MLRGSTENQMAYPRPAKAQAGDTPIVPKGGGGGGAKGGGGGGAKAKEEPTAAGGGSGGGGAVRSRSPRHPTPVRRAALLLARCC